MRVVVVREKRLRESVVVGECLVVAVLVAATVCAGVRLEGQLREVAPDTQVVEHVVQHGVWFDRQITVPDLDWDMAIAEVIRRARQRVGIGTGDAQHGFSRGAHFEARAVLGQQLIARLQRGAGRQGNGQFAAIDLDALATASTLCGGQLQRVGGESEVVAIGGRDAGADEHGRESGKW
jgi:hypothetical protein